MILLDTGPLVALCNHRDSEHHRARTLYERVLQGTWGAPISTDYVLDEGLTLLQMRFRDKEAGQAFSTLFYGRQDAFTAPLQMRATTPDMVEEAVALHFDQYDRRLSLTDCTLIIQARRCNAVVATLDSGFEGLVPTVDW